MFAWRFISSIVASKYGISALRISVTDGGEVGIAVSGMVTWRASRRASRSLDCASG